MRLQWNRIPCNWLCSHLNAFSGYLKATRSFRNLIMSSKINWYLWYVKVANCFCWIVIVIVHCCYNSVLVVSWVTHWVSLSIHVKIFPYLQQGMQCFDAFNFVWLLHGCMCLHCVIYVAQIYSAKCRYVRQIPKFFHLMHLLQLSIICI